MQSFSTLQQVAEFFVEDVIDTTISRILAFRRQIRQLCKLAEQKDRHGNHPLHSIFTLQQADLFYKDLIAEQLVEVHPEAVVARNEDGYYPIHLASLCGETASVLFLLSVVQKSAQFETHRQSIPLHCAALGGHTELCSLLVQHWPEGLLKINETGHTAESLAGRCGHEETAYLLRESKMFYFPPQPENEDTTRVLSKASTRRGSAGMNLSRQYSPLPPLQMEPITPTVLDPSDSYMDVNKSAAFRGDSRGSRANSTEDGTSAMGRFSMKFFNDGEDVTSLMYRARQYWDSEHSKDAENIVERISRGSSMGSDEVCYGIFDCEDSDEDEGALFNDFNSGEVRGSIRVSAPLRAGGSSAESSLPVASSIVVKLPTYSFSAASVTDTEDNTEEFCGVRTPRSDGVRVESLHLDDSVSALATIPSSIVHTSRIGTAKRRTSVGDTTTSVVSGITEQKYMENDDNDCGSSIRSDQGLPMEESVYMFDGSISTTSDVSNEIQESTPVVQTVNIEQLPHTIFSSRVEKLCRENLPSGDDLHSSQKSPQPPRESTKSSFRSSPRRPNRHLRLHDYKRCDVSTIQSTRRHIISSSGIFYDIPVIRSQNDPQQRNSSNLNAKKLVTFRVTQPMSVNVKPTSLTQLSFLDGDPNAAPFVTAACSGQEVVAGTRSVFQHDSLMMKLRPSRYRQKQRSDRQLFQRPVVYPAHSPSRLKNHTAERRHMKQCVGTSRMSKLALPPPNSLKDEPLSPHNTGNVYSYVVFDDELESSEEEDDDFRKEKSHRRTAANVIKKSKDIDAFNIRKNICGDFVSWRRLRGLHDQRTDAHSSRRRSPRCSNHAPNPKDASVMSLHHSTQSMFSLVEYFHNFDSLSSLKYDGSHQVLDEQTDSMELPLVSNIYKGPIAPVKTTTIHVPSDVSKGTADRRSSGTTQNSSGGYDGFSSDSLMNLSKPGSAWEEGEFSREFVFSARSEFRRYGSPISKRSEQQQHYGKELDDSYIEAEKRRHMSIDTIHEQLNAESSIISDGPGTNHIPFEDSSVIASDELTQLLSEGSFIYRPPEVKTTTIEMKHQVACESHPVNEASSKYKKQISNTTETPASLTDRDEVDPGMNILPISNNRLSPRLRDQKVSTAAKSGTFSSRMKRFKKVGQEDERYFHGFIHGNKLATKLS